MLKYHSKSHFFLWIPIERYGWWRMNYNLGFVWFPIERYGEWRMSRNMGWRLISITVHLYLCSMNMCWNSCELHLLDMYSSCNSFMWNWILPGVETPFNICEWFMDCSFMAYFLFDVIQFYFTFKGWVKEKRCWNTIQYLTFLLILNWKK